jgi:hypothetical protein
VLPPVVRNVTVSGVFKEGEKLTASYKYDGGHEGNSEYAWYTHTVSCLEISGLRNGGSF